MSKPVYNETHPVRRAGRLHRRISLWVGQGQRLQALGVRGGGGPQRAAVGEEDNCWVVGWVGGLEVCMDGSWSVVCLRAYMRRGKAHGQSVQTPTCKGWPECDGAHVILDWQRQRGGGRRGVGALEPAVYVCVDSSPVVGSWAVDTTRDRSSHVPCQTPIITHRVSPQT